MITIHETTLTTVATIKLRAITVIIPITFGGVVFVEFRRGVREDLTAVVRSTGAAFDHVGARFAGPGRVTLLIL